MLSTVHSLILDSHPYPVSSPTMAANVPSDSHGFHSPQVNHDVNPYVTPYYLSGSNSIGSLMHFRWSGCLPLDFAHGLLRISL